VRIDHFRTAGGEHMGNRGLLVAALSASLFAASCKATVEGENKAWDGNVQRVNQLAAVYPGFAAALHEQQQRAEAAMAAARGVSDKEQQARKMAEANSLLTGGFVTSLGQIEPRTRQLREKLVSANSDTTPGGDQAARLAADDAQRILRNTDDALKAGAPSAGAATAVMTKVDGDLTSAAANLDRVITAARTRKQEAAKLAGGASGTTVAPTAAGAAPTAQVQWKCTYCNHMNADSRQKCEECGAPRPQPKALPKKK
jgi:hypothetical protein